MNEISKERKNGLDIIIYELGNLKKDEKLCIISDKNTENLGNLFFKNAKESNFDVEHLIMDELKMHGEEPPKSIAESMKKSNLIIGLTSFSIAHSKARINAELMGIRYLSLPDYSKEILSNPALQENFLQKSKKLISLANKLSRGKKIRVISEKGTNIELDIENRKGNSAPGFVNNKILLGSPPDIEVNISPNENYSNGEIVIDGSIPHPKIGLLEKPIILKIENGVITSISGDPQIKSQLESIFSKYSKKSRILAELGIGYNSMAKLSGNMLIDEGTYGTIHFGFGSNLALGGLNEINFHLDFVTYEDSIIIDDETIKI